MALLKRVYDQLSGMPLEVLSSALAEYSCCDLQALIYAPSTPEVAVEAADIILTFRMSNLPQAARLMQREDLVEALSPDMLQALLKRQADVTLRAFADLQGDLQPVSMLARQLLETRDSLSLELNRMARPALNGSRTQ